MSSMSRFDSVIGPKRPLSQSHLSRPHAFHLRRGGRCQGGLPTCTVCEHRHTISDDGSIAALSSLEASVVLEPTDIFIDAPSV
jgi:hypothetical protein